jgi:hypothetical protein
MKVGALGIKRSKDAVTSASQGVIRTYSKQPTRMHLCGLLVGISVQINKTSGGVNGGTECY